MHCDDKRTIFALKQYIIEATAESQVLQKKLQSESNSLKKKEIQTRISFLQKAIHDSKDQIESS